MPDPWIIIVKISIVAKVACRFNMAPMKVPTTFFLEINDRKIHLETPETIAKASLKDEDKTGGNTTADLKHTTEQWASKQFATGTEMERKLSGTEP